MRTRSIWVSLIALSLSSTLVAQPDWNTLGNRINGGEWFGAAPGSTIPLSFETRVNQPMYWTTNNARRMQLYQTLMGQTVNGFGGLDLSG